MNPPEIPKDELGRLKTLYSLSVLDTPAEERFDRLTRMAKRMFNVPIALVSLVDENRQWFKSAQGLDAKETPRDVSFCGHSILGDEIFAIPNAKEDERFADNPLVLNDPNIRFYAGCPLSAPNGDKLGTLCIIDSKPRELNKEDYEALQDLAATVERELAAVQLATFDELTGISNRRGFMMLAEHSLHLCKVNKLDASLIFLDLDKLKAINDNFGHAEGDKTLATFADLMKEAYRESDLFARLGGDEFVVLLSNASRQTAEAVVQRFGEHLDKFNHDSDQGYSINFSYGIVEYDAKKHCSVGDLLADGDQLMYETKLSKAS